MEEIVPKARPGRPKKIVNTPKIPICGISNTPKDPHDRMELTYSDPKLFKKVFSVFKTYSCENIQMVFDTTSVVLAGVDHTENYTVTCRIEPTNLNHYYCAENISITVKRVELERIVSTFDKGLATMSFILTEENMTVLNIITTDNEFSSRDNSVIELMESHSIDYTPYGNITTSFVLSGKHFKKKISDIIKIADNVMICQVDGILSITSADDDQRGTVKHDTQYTDMSKIKYVGTEQFTLTMKAKCIKPFSSTNIGNEVQIGLDPAGGVMVLTTTADKRDAGAVFTVSTKFENVIFI